MNENNPHLGDIRSLSTGVSRGDTHGPTNENPETNGDVRESTGQDVENTYAESNGDERIASGRSDSHANDFTETSGDDEQPPSDQFTENIVLLQNRDEYLLPAFEQVQTANNLLTPETHTRTVVKPNKNEEIKYTGSSNTAHLRAEESKYNDHNERQLSFQRCKTQKFKENAEKLGAAGYYVTVEGIVKCFYCKAELGNWTERHNEWEWHAVSNYSCPHLQQYYEREYKDLKAAKLQVFGEQQEHLRLKEWLLCKSCSMNCSNILLFPCQHMCLCVECAQKVSVCPSCGIHVLNMISVILFAHSLR